MMFWRTYVKLKVTNGRITVLSQALVGQVDVVVDVDEESTMPMKCQYEKKILTTGRSNGATGDEYAKYIMDTIQSPGLEQKWQSYQ